FRRQTLRCRIHCIRRGTRIGHPPIQAPRPGAATLDATQRSGPLEVSRGAVSAARRCRTDKATEAQTWRSTRTGIGLDPTSYAVHKQCCLTPRGKLRARPCSAQWPHAYKPCPASIKQPNMPVSFTGYVMPNLRHSTLAVGSELAPDAPKR